ncbi:hypothetical protein MP477_09390 [Chryseobacterium sp. WG23]|uniref:hypothetical protein n=1 Tax=Chryseobacterium sp. WG23 TaxID=2926910 RepID=UPI00211ED5AA|nr:hypothetical protein [Chryseobacterium sp. WG23]MCQ9635164.1 hypothetical protein [Chryseobacterium sp. WG23]
MKRLIFEEIQILSYREKKAIKIQFNPKKTIIKGPNQVGKSSLLKSIYYTLGATPSVLNSNWLKAEPITYLKFKVDELRLSVLRYDKSRYAVLNENQEIVPHDFKSLSIFLNELFGFNVLITNRKGEGENPPSPFLFLPFYIDQDKSWNDSWNAFSGLGQYSKWKKPVIEYHSGIKGYNYYQTKTELDSARIAHNEIKIEVSTLNKILGGIKEKLNDEDFNLTIEDFNTEVSELLKECEILKTEQNKIKLRLTDLYNQKSMLDARVMIIENAIGEAKADYKYALNVIDDVVDCPMCGAHYENDFNERFSIAEDEEKLQELRIELKMEIVKVNDEISEYNSDFVESKISFERIEELLNTKKEEIKLIDIIENEGKKKVNEIFNKEKNLVYQKIGDASNRLDLLEKQLKDINKESISKKRKIMLFYKTNLRKFLLELNVDPDKISKTLFDRLDNKINEQGSNLPRALLAYYFAFLHITNNYSTSTFCPIVVDSPNQQEQDEENRKAIMNFIYNNQPEESQIILGVVDDIDTELFDGDIIKLEDDKYSLLKKEYFQDVNNEILPIIEKIILHE